MSLLLLLINLTCPWWIKVLKSVFCIDWPQTFERLWINNHQHLAISNKWLWNIRMIKIGSFKSTKYFSFANIVSSLKYVHLFPVPAVPAPPSHLHANEGYPHEVNNHSRTFYLPLPATSQRPPKDCHQAVESHGQLKQKSMDSAENGFVLVDFWRFY